MPASEKIGQKLPYELKLIEALQREWNALSMAERLSIAKVSPDLRLFFRRGLAKVDRRLRATGKIIDLQKTRQARHRQRAGEAETKLQP